MAATGAATDNAAVTDTLCKPVRRSKTRPMTYPSATILITGYPGAGKSRLIDWLGDPGDRAVAIVEAHGLSDLSDEADAARTAHRPVRAIIALADAVNLQATLQSDHSGPFTRAQIAGANLIVLSRTDVIDAAAARAALSAITQAPVIDRPDLTWDSIDNLDRSPGTEALDIASPAATEWSYAGPAQLRARDIDEILEQRPAGLYRVSGMIRTESGAVEVEIAGRVRQTRPVEDPGETCLSGLSPGRIADRRSIDLWFTEAVASSAHLMGGFSYR